MVPAVPGDCLQVAAQSLCYTQWQHESCSWWVAETLWICQQSNEVCNLPRYYQEIVLQDPGQVYSGGILSLSVFSPSPEPHTKPGKSFAYQTPTYISLYWLKCLWHPSSLTTLRPSQCPTYDLATKSYVNLCRNICIRRWLHKVWNWQWLLDRNFSSATAQ